MDTTKAIRDKFIKHNIDVDATNKDGWAKYYNLIKDIATMIDSIESAYKHESNRNMQHNSTLTKALNIIDKLTSDDD